ncbi:MAG: acetoin utilization protein AcuC [Actinomycetota bacterium]|nr:acetoin utilization protein AcuC [Actinomycetota bacterium]
MAGEQADAAGPVALVWDGELEYDFGPTHPLKPVRVELTVELIRALEICDGGRAVEVPAGSYTEDELLQVHDADYVDTVKRLSSQRSGRSHAWEYGLGPGDNPIFAGMHEASMRVCAASKEAARRVWQGEAKHAFNPAGGLHHAMRSRASGFCIYNDPAVAINWLLENGADRIAYIDVDVHHGDGVEAIFYDDPRVLTVSLHESGSYLFPGTGWPDDIGGEGARGSAVNLPLSPRTTGDVWLEAFDAVTEPLVRSFNPDVLVTQLGCDTHATDPLAHLALTVNDYGEIARRLHQLAHETADGRWLATGGGGYQIVQVVPRAWATYFAEMSGFSLPDAVPQNWRDVARSRRVGDPPLRFRDEPAGIDAQTRGRVEDAARRSVEAVREFVFPHHGLDR